MDLKLIEKNQKILDLDSTVIDIEDSTLICENPEIELIQMRSEVFFLMLDYLQNPNSPVIEEYKRDIILYKDGYENLCKRLNDYIEKASQSLRNLLNRSNKLKKEIKEIIKQFEKNIKNLCITLIAEEKGLDTINTSKLTESEKDDLIEDKLEVTYKIKEFKKESENLNKQYNKLFNKINHTVQILYLTIKEIPSSLTNIQDKIEEGMSKYEEILEDEFSDIEKDKNGNFQNLLMKSFELINKEMDKIITEINGKISNLNIQYKKRKESFISLRDESNKIIEKLTLKSNSIIKYIGEVRKKNKEREIKLPEIKISELLIEKIIEPMEDSIKCVKEQIDSVFKVPEILIDIVSEIIKQTPLYCLFIMNTTGSMEQYIETTTNN